MYKREVLGLEEARAIAEAALAEASKEPNRPMAVAVVDDRGDLIYCAKMDGAAPLYMHMAINKAYTATRMMRDTAAFAELQREFGRELTTWGDSKFTLQRGGQCIIKPGDGYIPRGPVQGTVLGGIGASGRSDVEDEQVAIAGLKALHL